MGCIAVFAALFFPRIILVLVWLLGKGWLQESYQSVLWPVLGFFLMPLTTLAYALAWHMGEGSIQGPGIVLLVIAVLVDLGLLGGGTRMQARSGSTGRPR
jgi:hypothetical protein